MTEVKSEYRCQQCKQVLDNKREPCPSCGSTLRDIHVQVTDEVVVRDSLSFKKFAENSKKFLSHLKQGWFPSKNIERYPDGVEITQNIDRENNLYTKKGVDSKTNEIVKDLQEPLHEHLN